MNRLNTWMMEHIYLLNSLIFLLFIINHFISNDSFAYIIGMLTVLLFLFSFPGSSLLFKVLSGCFIVLGIASFVYSGLSIMEIPTLITSTLPILTLLFVLPLMTSVVRAGRYDRRLNEIMKGNVKNLGELYVRCSMTTFILSAFLNISALSLSQEVLVKSMSDIEKKMKNSFISQATLKGLALALVWSPMEIIVALTVDATGVSYLAYLPWLFLCAVFVMILDGLYGRKRFGPVSYKSVESAVSQVNLNRLFESIIKLFLAFATFLGFVVSLGALLKINFILSVSLMIPPFALVWAILLKRWRSFTIIGLTVWKERANRMQNFIVLFVSLAFFSNSLSTTSFHTIINQLFSTLSDWPLVILLCIQFFIILMGLVGVHAIATIGILLEVVNPLYSIINPLSIGIVIITGALATLTVGVYGVTVTMTSMTTKQNPYRITLQNLPFALTFGFTGVILGYVLL